MLIYAAADIHGAQYRINNILDVIKKYEPDIVTICGDITQFGPGDVATNLLNQIPGNILAVLGNIDTSDVIDGVKKSKAYYLDFNRYDIGGISFIGLNGVSDKETISFFRNSSYAKLFKNVDVMVSHVPPYGFQDTIFLGRHAGSKILLEIMNELKPHLFLCGHIHEDPGFTENNGTVVVNCSMGKRGKGAIIDYKDSINVEMIT